MTTTFEREIRPVDITQLKNELNGSVDITATVIDIALDTESLTGNNINITWNTDLLVDEITAQDVVIANHIVQIPDFSLTALPLSELGNKLAIHSSTKPAPPGNKEFYLVWTGAGDDVQSTPNVIGDGQMLQFTLTTGKPTESIEVHFSPDFGDVYVHEGYAKWENGGAGDYLEADVIASATPLQTVANKDLEIVDNWVKLAAGGPGTGTHGFAASPTLIKRSKSKDGNWDFSAETGLVPNISATGLYKISDIERAVHHYFNKIPTRGNSYGYENLTSDESAWLPPGYFIRVTANNVSDSDWLACVFMEVFREQTAVP